LTGWGRYQTAEEMEIGRRYEYDSAFFPTLYGWLGLRPGMLVVDVGCGSGYFTRILARGLQRKGKVIGIDPDETLILNAERIAYEERLSNVEFKVGSIYEIPLPANYADLITCHIVLCNLPRQFDALLEMKRVVRTGGKVAVIEPAGGGGVYYPDERLNRLHKKFRRAFGKALSKEWRQKLNMSGYVEKIHLKLPELFLKAGLKNTTLNGYLSAFLLCDARHKIEEIRNHLKARLNLWQKLKERNKECARIGGMSEEEFEELFQKYSDYLKDLVERTDKIRRTAQVEIVSRVIICGSK
jgi:ubiquinone/menaquinone biosynthesis C-methylase UbiE